MYTVRPSICVSAFPTTPPACPQAPSLYVSRQSRKNPSVKRSGSQLRDDAGDEVSAVDRDAERRATHVLGERRVGRRVEERLVLGVDGHAVDVRRQEIQERRVLDDAAGRAGRAGARGPGRRGCCGGGARSRASRWGVAAGGDRGARQGAAPQPAAASAEATRPGPGPRRASPSSRRTTGKRSSAAATCEPERLPERRRCGARRVGRRADLRVRLDGREAAPGEVVADAPRRAVAASPRPRAPRVVAMHVITAGSGDCGQLRVEVAGPQGARVRGQRPELRVGGGLVVVEQDLGVASRTPPSPRPSSGSLRGASRRDRRAGRSARARTGSRGVVVVRGRTGLKGAAFGAGANGLNAGSSLARERVRRPRGRAARGGVASSHAAARPSSRGRRPPSSRTCDGRTRDRRTAGRARTRRRR